MIEKAEENHKHISKNYIISLLSFARIDREWVKDTVNDCIEIGILEEYDHDGKTKVRLNQDSEELEDFYDKMEEFKEALIEYSENLKKLKTSIS